MKLYHFTMPETSWLISLRGPGPKIHPGGVFGGKQPTSNIARNSSGSDRTACRLCNHDRGRMLAQSLRCSIRQAVPSARGGGAITDGQCLHAVNAGGSFQCLIGEIIAREDFVNVVEIANVIRHCISPSQSLIARRSFGRRRVLRCLGQSIVGWWFSKQCDRTQRSLFARRIASSQTRHNHPTTMAGGQGDAATRLNVIVGGPF